MTSSPTLFEFHFMHIFELINSLNLFDDMIARDIGSNLETVLKKKVTG